MPKPKSPHCFSFWSTHLQGVSRVFFAVCGRSLLTPVIFYTRAYARKAGRQLALASILLLVAMGSLGLNLFKPAVAHATTSDTINFQARLENSDGAIADDGTYDVVFKIYSVSTGGIALWTEDDTTVRVADGYLTVNLGNTTAFPSNMPWDQNLWLTMNVNGDGEMTPRLQLTAVPYAFQAAHATTLQVSSGGNSSTLQLTTPTANDIVTVPDESGTVCLGPDSNNPTANNCGFAAGTGSNAYIQNGVSLQSNASFYIQASSANSTTHPTATIAALTGQTQDLLQFADASNNPISGFNSSGQIYFNDGSGNIATIVQQGLTHTTAEYDLPDTGTSASLPATFCILYGDGSGGNCTGGAGGSVASTGTANHLSLFASPTSLVDSLLYEDHTARDFIGLGTTTNNGLFSVQGPAAGGSNAVSIVTGAINNVALTVTGVSGQTADLLDVATNSGTVASFDASGNFLTTATGTFGSSSLLTGNTGQLNVLAGGSSSIGQVIRAGATQTGNLLEVQNSSGTAVSGFNGSGQLFFKDGSGNVATIVQQALTNSTAEYDLPDTGTSASLPATICILYGDGSGGNCTGGAGGSVASTGTANHLALFAGTTSLIDSLLYESHTAKDFIGLGTTTNGATTANGGLLSIQGASASQSSLAVVGAASATVPVVTIAGGATPGSGADLLDLTLSDNSVVASFDSAGNFHTTGSATIDNGVTVTNNSTFTGNSAGSGTAATINTGAASNLGLVIKGAASQTGSLLVVRDSTNSTLINVGSGGPVAISPSSGSNNPALTLTSGVTSHVVEQIVAKSGQTADLLQLQNSTGTAIGGFNASGQLYSGDLAGNYTQLAFTNTGTNTITFPAATGTVCLQTSTSCGFESTTGTDFIKNQTTAATIQTASEFFQGASGNVTSTIRGEPGNTADILDLQTGAVGNAVVASFDKNGNFHTTGSVTVDNGVTVTNNSTFTGNSAGSGTALSINTNATSNIGLSITGVAGQSANILQALTSTSKGLTVASGGSVGISNISSASIPELQLTNSAASQAILQLTGAASQTGSFEKFVSSAGATLGGFSSAGQLYSGDLAGNYTQLAFTNTGTNTITFPAATGTVCLQTASTCGFESTTGTDFIQNNPASQQTANFNILANSGKVSTIQGSSGQDIADFLTNGGSKIAYINQFGSIFGNSFSATESGSSGTDYVANFTDTNTSATASAVNGYKVALTGTTNTSGGNPNTLNGVNFGSITPVTGNVFNGLSFADTNYNSILTVAGTSIINGSGQLQNAGLDSSINYSNLQHLTNLTATGALTVQGASGLTIGSTSNNGVLNFLDGTADGFTGTIQLGGVIGANQTYTLPTAGGTFCLQTSSACGFESTTGTDFIRNQTAQQTSANFNIDGSGTIGNGLTVSAGGASILGATTINTSGTAATAIGNSTGSFSVASSGLNISTAGALTGVSGITFASGNFDQSASSGTFQTGSGAVSLNGNTTVTGSGTLTVGGLGTFNNGLTLLTGNTFTNASSSLFTAKNLGNLDYSGSGNTGSIGSSATTVDVATTFNIAQTTTGQTFTVPSPTAATAGRLIYINNTGTTSFNIGSVTLNASAGIVYMWNGSAWVALTSGSSVAGVTTIGTLDTTGFDTSANGATISGNVLYLQSATASVPGLVNTGAQTFGGNKTFNGTVNSVSGFQYNGTSGSTIAACSSSQTLVSEAVGGGLVTAGSCAAINSFTTLQNAYDNSATTNPQIQLSNANGGLKIRDAASSTIGNLLDITNSTGATHYLQVSATGTTVGGTLNVSGASTFTGLGTFNGGLTVATGQHLIVNGDDFTDLTGSGLTDVSNALTVDASSSTGFFRNGGNSFGAQAELGTNDNNALAFRTNNADRLILGTTGNLTFQQASTINILQASGTTTGSNLTIAAGQGGSGGAAGGVLALQGGAGAGTNQNGGNLTIDGGAKTGTGSVGNVILQGSGGNVGIGTSGTPSQLLSVGGTTGNFTVASSGNTAITNTVNGNAGLTITNSNSGVSPNASVVFSNGTISGSVGITGTNYTTIPLFQNSTFLYGGSGKLTVDTGAAQPIVFGINNSEAGRFSSSGNLLLGNTSGTSLLSVGSSAQFTVDSSGNEVTSGTIQYANGSTNTATYVCKNSSGQLAACNTTGTGAAFVQGGNSFGAAGDLGTNDAFSLNLRTNGTTRLTVDQSGNLQFAANAGHTLNVAQQSGTTAGDQLTIAAGQGGGGTTGAAGGVLALQGGAAAGTGNNNGGNVTIDGGALTGTGTKGFVILQGAGGKVGIGTSGTPTSLLSVGGSTGNLTVDTAGNLGTSGKITVGTIGTPQSIFLVDTGANTNTGTSIGIHNNSSGTGAFSSFAAYNDNAGASTHYALFGVGGTGYTGLSLIQNSAFALAGSGTNGLVLGTQGSTPTIFAINSTEVARFDSAGALNLGLTGTSTGSIVLKGSTAASGAITLTLATNNPGTHTINVPDAAGTICLQSASACGFATGSGAAFVQGGNSFGAQAELGTNDNNALAFRTNNADRLVLSAAGNLTFQQASTLGVLQASGTTTGSNLTVAAGQGGSGGAAGGVLALQGGAGAGTNQNGGNLTIDGGAATGTGTKGSVVIQASGGNVGVGTSSPSALLSVGSGSPFQVDGSGHVTYVNASTTATTLVCSSSSQLAGCDSTFLNPTATNFIKNSTSVQTSASFFVQGGSGNVSGVIRGESGNTADILDLQTGAAGNAVVASFDKNGNFHTTGSATVDSSLTVTGGASITGTTGANDIALMVHPGADGTRGLVIQGVASPTSGDLLEVNNNAGSNLVRVTYNGGLDVTTGAAFGIGTFTGIGTETIYAQARTTSTPTEVLRQITSQTSNLLQFQNTSGTALGGFNTSGQLYSGDLTGNYTQLAFSNTGTNTITFPAATGTVCLQTSTSCGFESTTGTDFIQNNPASQQTSSSFNIAAGAGKVAATIQGAASQDVADFLLSGGGNAFKVDVSGNITSAGNLTVSGTGNSSVAGKLAVGTASAPTYTLDVNGSIGIKGSQALYDADALGTFTGTLYVGNGGGSLTHTTGSDAFYNTAVGVSALQSNTTGNSNTGVGYQTLQTNSTGSNNTAVGTQSLHYVVSGTNNAALGVTSLYNNLASNNTAVGSAALYNITSGGNNVGVGRQAGFYLQDGATANQTSSNSVYLGYLTEASANGDSNEIVIGASAVGNGSNTVTLGNSSITATYLQGNVHLALDATSGSTVVCRNASGNLSACTNSYETTTGTDFIKNQTTAATVQSASEFFQGASGNVTSTIRGESGNTADILDLQTGAAGNAIVAKFDHAGNLTAAGGTFTALTNGGSGGIVTTDGSGVLGSSTLNLGTTSYITGQLPVANGGTGVASFANTNSLLFAGTTSTGALQNLANGSSGTILKSNGSGSLPSWVGATATNTCTDCVRQAPTTNAQNTIQPATSAVVGLTVQETSTGTAADILDIRNAGGATLLDAFDSTGALNLGVTAVPISSGSIDLGSSSKLFRSGYFATSVLTGTLDTASSGQLNIGASGTPTATQINLNQGTQLAGGKSLTFASGSGVFDQSASTGTFKTGTGIVSLNGSTQVAAGKNLTLLSGNGSIVVQGYGATNGSAESITANSLTTGNFVNLQNSGSAYTGTAILADLAAGASGTFTGNFLDFQNNDASQFKVDSAGTLYVQGHQGVTDNTCSAGEVLTGASYYGGIASGGTCSAPSGFVTLQNAYNNSGTTQPQIQIDSGLNSTTGLTISDDGTAAGGVHAPLSGNIFQVTNYNNGGTVYLGVASSGITTSGTLTANGGSPSTIAGELKATNTTANGGVSILASGITETNSLKVGNSFQFGVDSSGNISTTGSLAVAPGGANPNTFNVSNNAQVSRTYKSTSSATADSLTAINGSTGTGVTITGLGITLTDTAAASGTNTLNGITLGSVTHNTAANVFNGINIGSGYDNLINAGSAYTVTGAGAVTEGGALTVSAGGASVKATSGNILTLQNTSSNVATVDNSGNFTAGTYNGQTITSAASFTGTVALATTGTANTATYLCYNSSNQIATCNTTGTGAAFVQGGNHFGASTAGILGTLDSGSTLNVVAGGATQFIVGTSGTVTFDNANNTITTQSSGNNLNIDTFSGATLGLGASSGTINVGTSSTSTIGIGNSSSTNSIGGATTFTGPAISTQANNFVGIANFNDTVTKNDANTRTFYGVNIQPTLSTGVSNANTTLVDLNVDNTVTASTGVTTLLLRLANNGSQKLSVDGSGNVITAGTVQYAAGTTNTAAYVCQNASGQLAGCNTTGTGAAFVQGGNSFGAQAELGTNDANSLAFRTNNADRAILDTSGNLTFQQASTISTGTGNLTVQANGTSTLTLATSGAGTINIGTANASTINLGNSTSTTVAKFTGGAYNLRVTNTGLGINDGGTAPTGDISFGNNAAAGRTINVLQAAANTNGDNLSLTAGQGSATGNKNGGNLVLQAGAGGGTGTSGSVIVKAQASGDTAAFVIQNSGATALLTADTSSSMRVKLGTGTPTLSTANSGNLYVTNTIELAGTGTLRVGDGTNGISFNDTGFANGASGKFRLSGTAENTKTVILHPEFAGATLHGTSSGSDINVGTLTSDFCSGSGLLSINTSVCATSTDEHNYYNWTTAQSSAQSYDIYVRWQVPSDADVSSLSNFSLSAYGWRSTSSDHAQVSVYSDAASSTACASSVDVATSNTAWTSTSVSLSSCSFTVNQAMLIKIHLSATQNNFARLGELTLTYKSQF